MDDLRKAAEMVLKALEEINKLSVGENAICLPAEIDGAMEAFRQALAKEEQEPVGYAHVEDLKREHHDFYVNRERGVNEVPLYTAPPQKEEGCAECGKQASKGWALYCVECVEGKREWVELSDEEIIEVAGDAVSVGECARLIEAKLKEKNG